jgi:hypothetical protein
MAKTKIISMHIFLTIMVELPMLFGHIKTT